MIRHVLREYCRDVCVPVLVHVTQAIERMKTISIASAAPRLVQANDRARFWRFSLQIPPGDIVVESGRVCCDWECSVPAWIFAERSHQSPNCMIQSGAQIVDYFTHPDTVFERDFRCWIKVAPNRIIAFP